MVGLTRDEQKSNEFPKINLYEELPVLVEIDKVITESYAICSYIAEKVPKKLIPLQANIIHCTLLSVDLFLYAELEPQLWQIRKHMALYPKDI